MYDNGQDRGEGPPTRAVQYLVQPPTQPVPSPHGTALGQGVRCLDNVCQPGARDEAISSHLNKRSSQPHHLLRHLILLRLLISALLDKTALALIRHFALRSVPLHIRITRFRDSTPSFFAPWLSNTPIHLPSHHAAPSAILPPTTTPRPRSSTATLPVNTQRFVVSNHPPASPWHISQRCSGGN